VFVVVVDIIVVLSGADSVSWFLLIVYRVFLCVSLLRFSFCFLQFARCDDFSLDFQQNFQARVVRPPVELTLTAVIDMVVAQAGHMRFQWFRFQLTYYDEQERAFWTFCFASLR
jgi:hypothetical protein